jgi:isopenicillin N synthase-like dioxygenase
MPLYDFSCSGGHVEEHIVPTTVRRRDCGSCDRPSLRQFSSQIAVVGPTTDTRGMYRRYVEASAEIDHAATKYEHDSGKAATLPNLWTQSKALAGAMTVAGENPLKST